jgi:predicted Zn finger-like uncharacterized protein
MANGAIPPDRTADSMHTRCPHCQTVFAVTPQQIAAREGLVRCGRCQGVFTADRYPVEDPAPAHEPPAEAERPAPLDARPEPSEPRSEAAIAAAGTTAPRQRTRALFWVLGHALLTVLLIVQILFFYGAELGTAYPALHPALERICPWLGCRIRPRTDIRLIDLAETGVAPHPAYDQALRLRATLVNRADFPQPFPLLEVSLTDRDGATIARRSFTPAEYLARNGAPPEGMPPHIAVAVQLDVTRPAARSTGYEIRLLPAD